MENLKLNVPLLRKRVPNLTSAARAVGLRPATVSNLCTGKIPVGRAEVRTIVALASLAKCSLDELLIREDSIEMLETGIKVVDLFAPIVKGGTVGLVARPGMGQLVVLAELFHNLKQNGYRTILQKPEGNYPELQDLYPLVDILSNSINDTHEVIVNSSHSNNHILFATDREHVLTGETFQLQERLEQEGISNVTTILLDLKGEVMDEEMPYGPLETVWHFDADLAARFKFPAVNPIYSTSSILEGAYIDQNHLSVQQRAKKLLRRYRELRALVQVRGNQAIPSSEKETYERGEKLEAYLTQPFFVAEEHTKVKGQSVSLQEVIQDVQTIISGGADGRRVEDVTFVGRL